MDRFGKLDVLVNNAGVTGSGGPDNRSTETWDRLMTVNARGTFLGIKHAVPEMQKVGGGSIVNISSIAGFVGQDGNHPGYNASKGAVRILTKSMAIQHAKDGIRGQLGAPRHDAGHAVVSPVEQPKPGSGPERALGARGPAH